MFVRLDLSDLFMQSFFETIDLGKSGYVLWKHQFFMRLEFVHGSHLLAVVCVPSL
jgi:hypothetical protein